MGQQQLLLLVIAIVVVAFAVMAGFEAAEKHYKQSIVDALVDRNLSIATDAVFWKTKRDPYSGGNASYTGLQTDGMSRLFLGETTNNGRFKITAASSDSLEITAVSLSHPEIGVRTTVRNYEIIGTQVSYDGDIGISQ